MATSDTCVTLVPYFKVRDGCLADFKALAERMVEQTRNEPKCLYYGFSFYENQAHCREGYTDASGVLDHLDNIGPLLAEGLEIAEITRLEVHGCEAELEKIQPHIEHLKPVLFQLEYGFRR